MKTSNTIAACLAPLVLLLAFSSSLPAQPPVDADWKGNATIDERQTASDPRLGAAQGVTSSPTNNIYAGKTRLVESFATPRGAWGFTREEDAEFARRFRKMK